MNLTTSSLLTPEIIRQLENLELISKKMLRGRFKGDRLTKRKGQSVEFADFKNYVIGDDLRFLDWNLFARLDRLFLRIFLEEEDLQVTFLLDASASMDTGEPSKLTYASQVIAALGYIGLSQLNRVRLAYFQNNRLELSRVLRGKKDFPWLLQTLTSIVPSSNGNLYLAARDLSIQSRPRGIVVFCSDFLDKTGYENSLRLLLGQQCDLYLFHILAEEEINPKLTGDLILVDCEDDDKAEMTVNNLSLLRYKQTVTAFQNQLSDFCKRRGIHYLFTSNQISFQEIVLKYFRQQGLVH